MSNSPDEPPRYILILGTLFLLAYAAYHLGTAWMDSAHPADEKPLLSDVTLTPTRTLIPSFTASPGSHPAAYPEPAASPTLAPDTEGGSPVPTQPPDFYPAPTTPPPLPSATSGPYTGPGETPTAAPTGAVTPTPTRTLIPSATPVQTGGPYPGPTTPPDASATVDPYPGATPVPSATPVPAMGAASPTPARTPTPHSGTPAPTGTSLTPTPAGETLPIITELPYDEIAIVFARTINQAVYSSDGDSLALATENGVYIYDADTHQNQRTLDTGNTLLSIHFAADDDLLVTGGSDGQIRWWEVETGLYLGALSGHLLGVTGLDLPLSGSPLLSGGDDALVRVWGIRGVEEQGVDSIQLQHTLRGPGTRVADVAVSRDGRMAAAASQGYVHIWNLQDGSLLKTFRLPHLYEAVAFSPDGQRLATVYNGQRLTLWDTATWDLVQFIPLSGPVRDAAYSPDGRLIAVGYEDGRIQVWDAGLGELRADLAGHAGLTGLTFSPDGGTLAVTSRQGIVRLWDFSHGFSGQ